MTIECCACRAVVGEKEGGEGPTATICPPCVKELFPDLYDRFIAEREAT